MSNFVPIFTCGYPCDSCSCTSKLAGWGLGKDTVRRVIPAVRGRDVSISFLKWRKAMDIIWFVEKRFTYTSPILVRDSQYYWPIKWQKNWNESDGKMISTINSTIALVIPSCRNIILTYNTSSREQSWQQLLWLLQRKSKVSGLLAAKPKMINCYISSPANSQPADM